MEDDAALSQILAANDGLTLVVNAYKDQVRWSEANGGRERSKSEEEVMRKNDGGFYFAHFHALTLVSLWKETLKPLFCLNENFLTLFPLFLQLLRVLEKLKVTTSSTCRHWILQRLTEKLVHHCLNPPHLSSLLIRKALSSLYQVSSVDLCVNSLNVHNSDEYDLLYNVVLVFDYRVKQSGLQTDSGRKTIVL